MGQRSGRGGDRQGRTALAHPDNRERIGRVIVRCEGRLVYAAHELGVHRRTIYKLVYHHELWPLVNRARIRRIQVRRSNKKNYLRS